MKKIMILLVLALTSCASSKEATAQAVKKEAVLYYSKGPCMGKCPVYDLLVYADGMLIYNSKDNRRKKISVISRLSKEELEELTGFLKNNLGEPTLFKKIRELAFFAG